MKILITGIHGFVGSNLVEYLKKDNVIYGLDIVSPERDGIVKTFSWADLDAGVVPAMDAIIHLAGKAHDTKNKSAAEVYFKVNTGLTQKIFDYFLLSGASKFVFFSTAKAAADRVKRNLKFYDKGDTILGEDLSKFATMRDQFSFYVTQLIYFANASVHLQEYAKTKPNNVYLREVIKALPAMDASLQRAKDSVVGWEKFGKGFDTFYEENANFFAENSRVICACVKSVQETELKKQLDEEAKKPQREVKQGKKIAFLMWKIKMLNRKMEGKSESAPIYQIDEIATGNGEHRD